MSTKRVFEKTEKIQWLYVPLCGHNDICAFDTGKYDYYRIDKIAMFCSDVNKTSTSIELLAINILLYMS